MAIAEAAEQEKTGARGLMTVCERIFRSFKYELPSTSLRSLEVTRELVQFPDKALASLLESVRTEIDQQQLQDLRNFFKSFKSQYGLELSLVSDAEAFLIQQAKALEISVIRHCEERFRDFHFGLQLVHRNTGRKAFELRLEDVGDLEKVLSRWVVESYQRPSGPPDSTPSSS